MNNFLWVKQFAHLKFNVVFGCVIWMMQRRRELVCGALAHSFNIAQENFRRLCRRFQVARYQWDLLLVSDHPPGYAGTAASADTILTNVPSPLNTGHQDKTQTRCRSDTIYKGSLTLCGTCLAHLLQMSEWAKSGSSFPCVPPHSYLRMIINCGQHRSDISSDIGP